MKVKVKYLGKRPESLKSYSEKTFVAGPYDFSGGPVDVETEDAKILLVNNPKGFEIVTETAVEETAVEETAVEETAVEEKVVEEKVVKGAPAAAKTK